VLLFIFCAVRNVHKNPAEFYSLKSIHMKSIFASLSLLILNQIAISQTRYYGEIKDGALNGFGCLYNDKDDYLYSGQFENGKKSGIGTLTFTNGVTVNGQFENDEFVGPIPIEFPWHLVDIEYRLDENVDFTSLSIDIEVLNDISQDHYLYIAPFGLGNINGANFYGGFQTHCGGYKNTDHIEHPTKFKDLGRAIIFSRWDSRNPSMIKLAEDGVCESADYEGDFLSVRNQFEWKKGKYRMTLYKTDQTILLNDTLHTFVGLKITSLITQETVEAGFLAFPGTKLMLERDLAIFAELYDGSTNHKDLPKITINFSNFKVNGNPFHPKKVWATYALNQPILTTAQVNNESISIVVGAMFNSYLFFTNNGYLFESLSPQ
jgi:hypothetical protein